ncbi:MAG TPA: protein kinase [Chthoniobacterales bacterium]
MNAEPPRPANDRDPGWGRRETRVCTVCGATFSTRGECKFCPVCMLRSAMAAGGESSEAPGPGSAETRFAPEPGSLAHRFEHYELVLGEDGAPLELGRGAMGVTYKAIDVDLRRPVTLKVIRASHVGDDSAGLRLLREARAAASVRHPNVASVFHLGQSGGTYFYAMEFVEGETLACLLRRWGRLEVKLALEITQQVAAGLVAVQKGNLVHRDIKSANIMVHLEQGGGVMAKIIDLGLAKPVGEHPSQTAISNPGAFAGTPEFASPEQFAGVGVDIRSDLYSLGVTLWEALTGRTPFQGSPAEVMHQHQRVRLPLEQLERVPQPVVVLLEVLLHKDPAHRVQTPSELLNLIPTVKAALAAGGALRETLRVFVSAGVDVQKERHVAEQVIRATAAEFEMPMTLAPSRFQRLAEAEGGSTPELRNPGPPVLCPCFWGRDPPYRGQGPSPAEADLAVCIFWTRPSFLPDAPWRVPKDSPLGAGTERDTPRVLDPVNPNGNVLPWHVYRNGSKPVPPLEPREAREAFGRQWEAVQEFIARWEKDCQGSAVGALSTYRDLEEFEALFREHFRDFLAGQLNRRLGRNALTRNVRRWKFSPFRGLSAFDFEHAPIFRGRTKAVGDVLEALEGQVRRQRPFVLVVGASGCGKSSLVRAGVLPLLTQPETIEGVGLWRRAITRPGAGGAGGDCFDALAAALLEVSALPALENPESPHAIRDLATELRAYPDSVALRVRDALDHVAREWKTQRWHGLGDQERRLRESGGLDEADLVGEQRERLEAPKARLALVVDQLEELFTTGFSPEVRQKYISTLAGLVRSGRVFVLATLRSDFYASYQAFPDLVELATPGGKVDLRPPTPSEIENVIRLPAAAAGLRFEKDPQTGLRLDDSLRDAATATPESLPLLEHVLSLLYDRQAVRGDALLRWSDYRELGELKGALARHAEAAFSSLQPDEQKRFPWVMRHLVTLGQGEEEVPNRRTVPYRDFVASTGVDPAQAAGAKGFIDRFIERRLLVAATDPQGEVTVSVAHEALLREWQRLKGWLTENREFLRMRDRLDSSLKLWLSRGKQKDDLLGPGLPLAEGETLVKGFGTSLNREQSAFVHASIAERKRSQRAQERVRYGVTAAVGVLAIVAGFQWFRAERQRQSAEGNAQRVQQNEARARALLREASKVDVVTASQQRDPAAKLAYLARALRNDSDNRVASITLEQLITRQASFPTAPLCSVEHAGRLCDVSFSPDGRWFLTASEGGTAQVWDAATGRPLGPPLRHEAKVNTASFSPDGQRVLTASADGTARIWEAATGKPTGLALRHLAGVNRASFSPDGRWVLTASQDGTARLWEAETGNAAGPPLRHEGFVYSAAFCSDGKRVVTAGSDGAARLWEPATGHALAPPLRHGLDVWQATFSPDGRRVATASADGTAQVWEAATGKTVSPPLRHHGSVTSVSFSPDGQWVLTASAEGTAQVWEAASGQMVGQPLRHEGVVNGAAFSPDGRWVITASESGVAQIWEAATGKPMGKPLRHRAGVNCAAFSPDGRRVATATEGGRAWVWEAATDDAVHEPLRHEAAVTGVALSPDGKWAVTASSDHTARLWEATTGKAVGGLLRHNAPVNAASFSPDGHWVVTASADGTARLWEVPSGKPLGPPLRHGGGVAGAAFSPNGQWVVTASWDGAARVWEAATGKLVTGPLQHGGAVNSAAFSPDGKWVATASADCTVRLWDALTGKPVGPPLQHDGYAWQAAFSPDGKWVITASEDGTARVWEAETGRAVSPPLRHDRGVRTAAFSPDGKWVVTASEDGTARVWDAATGQPMGEALRHDGVVHGAAFSPDGRWVVTASADGTARVWEAATGQAVGEPLKHDDEVLFSTFSSDGQRVVTASKDHTARVWELPIDGPLSERLVGVVKLLPPLIGHLDFDANGFLMPVPIARVIECRDQVSAELKEPGIKDSLLAIAVEWFLADPCTRAIHPGSTRTVPHFMFSTIDWGKVSGPARDPPAFRKKALAEAYNLDPAFPLIHLALASVEADTDRAAFWRDFDLKRLPDSCRYTLELDPAETTLEAAEMCAEQKDWPRAIVALDQYAKVGKPNPRSEGLRAQAKMNPSPKGN